MPREGDFDPLADTAVGASSDSSRQDDPLGETAVDTEAGERHSRSSFTLSPQLTIGRFVALEKLGEGGMGLVIAAFDPQLDRRVAIKMLHDDVSELQGSRLVREAKAMAQLNHPNVLAVYETGLYGDRLYIAMEYVDGQTFGQWLRAQPRTHDEIFELLLQAGRGLAAAHEVGLVHRDFKPDNILIGKDGRARVSDFGLVSATGEQVPAAASSPAVLSPSALTQTGAVMGTPLYMAPEQHAGLVADAKADQFSYCVTLWQALCGDLPYGADTYKDLVHNVTGGKLRPVPRGVRVPADIRAILIRGLSSDPAARFPSMQALLAAIARARRPVRWPYIAGGGGLLAAAGVAVALAMPRTTDPCATSPQRLAGVWDAPRKTELAATFGAARGADVWTQVSSAIDRYTTSWVGRHRAVCQATHVRREQSPELLDLRMRCLDGRLAELDALLARFAETKPETLFKAIDAVAGLPSFADCDNAEMLRAAIPLPTDPAARARIDAVEQALAEVISFDKTGQFARAKELLEPLVDQARAAAYAPLEAKVALLRAGLLYRSGDLAAAADAYRGAAEIAARARDDARIAQSWIDLINVLAAAGKYADALALEPIARTARERVSDQPKLGARLANVIAGIHLAQGRYPEARAEYEKALAFVREDGPDSELLGHALTNMGLGLWYTGDLPGAMQHLEDARDRFIATLGPRHPSLGYIYRNLGDLAAAQGNVDTALDHYLHARQIFEGANGPDHIDVAIALDPLGWAYAQKGDTAKAREAGERALALRERKFGRDHVSLAVTLNALTDAELTDGSPAAIARGLAHAERALAIHDAALGPEHPKTPEILDRAGDAASRLGKHDAAIAYFRRSVAIRTKLHSADHADTIAAQLRLAKALHAARRTTEAVALARAMRTKLANAPDRKPLVDAIDAWLAATAK